MNLQDRLERNIERIPEAGCWVWTGALDGGGYARVFFNGKSRKASRIVFEALVRPIPAGLNVLHTCDNRTCLNPAHLYLGTYKDNARDRDARGRRTAPVGERNPNAKLTEDAVRHIRATSESGVALSARFDVSESLIRHVRTLRSWKHVQ